MPSLIVIYRNQVRLTPGNEMIRSYLDSLESLCVSLMKAQRGLLELTYEQRERLSSMIMGIDFNERAYFLDWLLKPGQLVMLQKALLSF